MKYLYSGRSGRVDPVRAAKTLIAGDGALARWPGAVALVAADGAVVCANDAARAVEPLLGPGAPLAAVLGDALAAGEARSVTLPLPLEDAEMELSVLPLSRGTHALVLGHKLAVARARDAGVRRAA